MSYKLNKTHYHTENQPNKNALKGSIAKCRAVYGSALSVSRRMTPSALGIRSMVT